MRRLITLALTLLIVSAASSFALAGNGVKFETVSSFDTYAAAGVDVELGLPGVPLRPMVEVLGWWATNDEQVSHLQAGLGARYYLFAASTGLFAEAKARYVVPLELGSEASTVYLAGGGYRLKAVIGIDLYASAILSDHDLLPEYMVGARIGF